MKVIGFNFTKVSANRKPQLLKRLVINTNIEFLEIEKEKIEMLKDLDPLKIDFRFSVVYQNQEQANQKKEKEDKDAEVSFDGNIVLSADKEEAKDILKSWKKREVPQTLKISLFNLILKRCSVRALALEEELGLPLHVGIPQIKPQQK
ncbi:MAG: hypothetical protein AABW80_05565 [Nanoarchaeota archaeon]